tara:strand:- start:108 stop:521 length:414 start_codon:yes stop_codon:yes gene_type:complete
MSQFSEAYVMLDSTRSVAQSIQHVIIRIYAEKNNLDVSFYGAEFKGIEYKHFQLKNYIFDYPTDNFIFYSIYQFYENGKGFDIKLMEKILNNQKKIHFAAENIQILNLKDLDKIKIELIASHINIANRKKFGTNKSF